MLSLSATASHAQANQNQANQNQAKQAQVNQIQTNQPQSSDSVSGVSISQSSPPNTSNFLNDANPSNDANLSTYASPEDYLKALQPAQTDSLTSQSDADIVPLNAISPETLSTFVTVIDRVRQEYIDTVSDEQLFADAITGMLSNLDPYAEYLDKQSYDNLLAFTEGEIAQVGLQVMFSEADGQWLVQAVTADSPAQQAGIAKGDYVHQIDRQKPSRNDSLHDVTQMLSGLAGSQVTLEVSNQGRRKRKLTLQRMSTVDSAVSIGLIDDIAVIHIPVFQTTTREQILDALVETETAIKGIVIDVRNNPGGVLESAVEVAGLIHPDDTPVVQVTNKHGIQQVLKTQGDNFLDKIPMVVLQNRYSASASEVLANSLKQANKAIIVGETSYGKGSVQSVIPINDEDAIKLTVAHYQGADGRKIDGIGVLADVILEPITTNNQTVEIELKDNPNSHVAENNSAVNNKLTEDLRLSQAVEVLQKQLAETELAYPAGVVFSSSVLSQ